tara:strand:- start:2497 stop:5049 length:2553 start_codon:yes stop_codon:yes gene_type:complete
MINFLKKLFGSRNERYLKSKHPIVKKINQLEEVISRLSDDDLKNKTLEFRERYNNGETLNKLLPEAFACVREAAKRTIGLRHFDVQIIGAIALHEGKIAEMKTGEGKTLVATLAAYLNAIPQKGVHIVTVNPYLAERDSKWMGQVFAFMGLTTGLIVPQMAKEDRKKSYECDITYGTNNELGFDYLRDNMVGELDDRVSRHRAYAIIDEIDSILISEARTPLIISGPIEESANLFVRMIAIVSHLSGKAAEVDDGEGDFYILEKEQQIHLTENGHARLEELLRKDKLLGEDSNLYDIENSRLLHYCNACLKALNLFNKNVEYMVKNGEVIIIDEHTGRAMPGRRWSDGIHQAVEAKEKVKIQAENQTLASITFQNYFRMYDKLSGMTGTADTEADEFLEIYNLEAIIIPTNRPMQRKSFSDKVYLDQVSKYDAIVEDIQERREKGQPILVGTCSVESSELLSKMLHDKKIAHEVLNAKNHQREADIIAQAGCKGALTISTNMAGRGTDIILGGNMDAKIDALGKSATEQDISDLKAKWKQEHEEVLELGGLHVIGAERNESRRVDNQLIGRSGRQGDPGSNQFYLAMDDNLLRIFASDKMQQIMKMFGVKPGEMLQAPMLTRSIETAQKKVEGHHFDIRKELLKYDDIANEQRTLVYGLRDDIMNAEHISDLITDMADSIATTLQEQMAPNETDSADWNLELLSSIIAEKYNLNHQFSETDTPEEIRQIIIDSLMACQENNLNQLSAEQKTGLEKQLTLSTVDHFWKDHLMTMDVLRQGIHFRGYAQKNPAHEYKKEALELFRKLLSDIRSHVWQTLTHIKINQPEPEPVNMSGSYQVSMAPDDVEEKNQ